AFISMVLLTVYTVYEAMRYSRQEIALLGLVGAYGIPFLISANSDRPELFFIYISLINLGVAFLFIKRSWRQVNWAAQVLTWVLFIGWASVNQTAGTKEEGVFFMCFFFLLFAASSVAFKISGKRRFIDADVWQICFSNAGLYIAALFIIGYSLNAGIAIITLSSSVLISLQVWFVLKYWKEELFLRKLLFTMALIMFVFFIFFNWDGFTVTLLWLLTAVVVFVCGFLKKSVSMRMLAIVLMGITLAKLLMLDSLSFGTIQKVIAYLVLGTLLLGVSFFYQKFKEQIFGRKH
ncbi:MAG TPA: DUF2339 domain-containing protein, partial [Flavisolibacter sp.]|nr:DUF2339 domain-containing protein [Flavisolibacter sp.]